MPNWFVVVMGVGTVFVGLVCLVILCKIIGLFCKGAKAPEPKAEVTAQIPDKQKIIAAVTAVCAEEMGKDIKSLRVVSFKKI